MAVKCRSLEVRISGYLPLRLGKWGVEGAKSLEEAGSPAKTGPVGTFELNKEMCLPQIIDRLTHRDLLFLLNLAQVLEAQSSQVSGRSYRYTSDPPEINDDK